ncbi:MAG: acyltransferase [Lachnospiraceae bacterium]|nr:acyltransferase [Lachnospiraceae bacterium]
MESKHSFSAEDTRIIKGVAILLMLFHHLLVSPDNYPYGTAFKTFISFNGTSLSYGISKFGNFCVSLFAFLGGYSIYKCYKKPHFFTNKLLTLYKNYWKIFFIFIPIGFIFFGNQAPHANANYINNVYSHFEFKGFILNLIGINYTYNSEWWFFIFYVKAVFLGLIFIRVFEKNDSYYKEILGIVVFIILLRLLYALGSIETFSGVLKDDIALIFQNHGNMATVFMGIVFSKYNLLDRVIGWLHDLPLMARKGLSILVIVAVFIYRYGMAMDYVLVPLFVTALFELFGYSRVTRKGLGFLGKNSSNMYYTHTFYIFYFGAVAKLIYKPNNAIVCYIIFVAVCLVGSVLINKFYELCSKKITIYNQRNSTEEAQ